MLTNFSKFKLRREGSDGRKDPPGENEKISVCKPINQIRFRGQVVLTRNSVWKYIKIELTEY